MKSSAVSGYMKGLLPFPVRRGHQAAESNNQSVVKSVYDEFPGCAMPDSHYQKHDDIGKTDGKGTPGLFSECFPGKSGKPFHPAGQRHRVKYIVFHPGSKGNVPAVPEIRNGNCKIGTTEIFIQFYAEQFPDSDYHIHTAGKITVKLYAVCQHAHHAKPVKNIRVVKNGIDKNHRIVRNHHFLKISP